ncbi:hypothetical protein D1BOALGB6SA_8802, partial [Olavius sp. associated proteobacterium Delta 1]
MNTARQAFLALKHPALGSFFLTCFLFLGIDCTAFAKTVYMGPGETYKSLNAAFSAMSGGDTLIIRDG